MIKDYIILNSAHPEKLQARVKELIDKGWQPLGTLILSTQCVWLYQAMVLYETDPRFVKIDKE